MRLLAQRSSHRLAKNVERTDYNGGVVELRRREFTPFPYRSSLQVTCQVFVEARKSHCYLFMEKERLMAVIEWNDGLSVGIQAIDDDHKKLVELINELYEALERGVQEDALERVFNNLERYIKYHFAREEELMLQHRFSETESHTRQHKQFIKDIERLKTSVLTSSSMSVAEEVISYLANWLIQHIVSEDAKLASLTSHGNDTRLSGLNSRIIRAAAYLTNRISFRKRMLFMVVIPVFSMLFFCMISIWSDFTQIKEAKKLESIFMAVNQSAELIHFLQAERGMSVGIINSGYSDFLSDIGGVRSHTDFAMKDLRALYTEIQYLKDGDEHKSLEQWEGQIANLRRMVNERNIDSETLRSAYSHIIDKLLMISDQMIRVEMPHYLNNAIIANISLMHFKEKVGVGRALGTKAIEIGNASMGELHTYLKIVGEQHGFMTTFYRTANAEQIGIWQRSEESEEVKKARLQETKLINTWEKLSLDQLDPIAWWEHQTLRMDKIQLTIRQLSSGLQKQTSELVLSLRQRVLSLLILASTLAAISLLGCYLLVCSVTIPVRKLTRALTHLSTGDRSVRVESNGVDDEFSHITSAYELCRRGLLQHDYERVKSVINEKETVRYKNLSSIDILTGQYNRRKFSELAGQEVHRAQRYHRPLAAMVLDIDYFKQVNDLYGHPRGDLVLRKVSHSINLELRSNDIFGRIGGEEFGIVLPEATLDQAFVLANRICERVAHTIIEIDTDEVSVTVSIGLAYLSESQQNASLDSLMSRADAQLYRAKSEGRNRVCAEPVDEAVDAQIGQLG